MENYREINGDLILLAMQGRFDAIVHGCNCFCTQGAGIAYQMSKKFSTDKFNLEKDKYKADINKLGQIDYSEFEMSFENKKDHVLFVINAYTQYFPGKDGSYDALKICLKKINHIFKGQHIGLPQIGCGIAGLDWEVVREIIQKELKDCEVTVVIFE